MSYRGRFAPSPTGLLHPGSLVAALGSWLDARAHAGRWLVRIEDTDAPRCSAAAAEGILGQLARLGLVSDEPVRRQSEQGSAYRAALDALRDRGLTYRCRCSRRELALWWATHPGRTAPVASQDGSPAQSGSAAAVAEVPGGERPYPGLCRARAWPADGPGAVRLATQDAGRVNWIDRRLGPQQQEVECAVGDFILLRSDGLWAYQLAVVVDDGEQGITHVVRGEDLADNTARQILLQRALRWPQPDYLHLPLVLGADGRKLSKQNGAAPPDLSDPVRALAAAAPLLGLPPVLRQADSNTHTLGDWLEAAVAAWPWRRNLEGLG